MHDEFLAASWKRQEAVCGPSHTDGVKGMMGRGQLAPPTKQTQAFNKPPIPANKCTCPMPLVFPPRLGVPAP